MVVDLNFLNYIRSSARTHPQFETLIQELENDVLPDAIL